MEPKVGKKYMISKKLGAGAFGQIYQAIDLTSKEDVAIKLEAVNAKSPQLFYEAKLYQYLHQDDVAYENGIPRVLHWSQEGEYNTMVMDLLGLSLEDLFTKCGRKFSVKTMLMLGEQMVARVGYLHSRRFLHRDIKPDNFAMGRGKNQHKVFMIDFGLAKKYMSRDGVHIPYRENKSLTGTARYASIATHRGIEQGRRDDLESIAYVLIYFVRGRLPWQDMKAVNKKEKYEKIMEKKVNTPIDELIRGCPLELGEFLTYSRSLKFEDKPDYDHITKLLRKAWDGLNMKMDFVYDWTSPSPTKTDPSPQSITSTQVNFIRISQKLRAFIVDDFKSGWRET